MSDLGPITMEAFIVKVTPINNLQLVVEHKPFTFTWNGATGTYDVAGGETSSEIVEVGTVKAPEQPAQKKVTNVDVGEEPFTIDGYVMQNRSYVFDDGSRYTETLRVGPAGELYGILPSGQVRVSYDNSSSWTNYSGTIPRAFNPPPSGPGGDEDIH